MKKNYLKAISLLAVCTLTIGMLAGCGKKDTETQNNEEVTEAGDETEVTDEATDETPVEEVVEVTDKQKFEGTWFGWMLFGDCTGKFEKSSGAPYANYLVLTFDDDSKGKYTISNSWEQYGSGEFEIVDGKIKMTSGDAFGAPINLDKWQFLPIDNMDGEIYVEDKIVDADGDELAYAIYLKQWGASWAEMNETYLYEDIFKPYEEKLASGEQPPYGFVNEYFNSNGTVVATNNTDSSDKSGDSDTAATGAEGGLDIPAVNADNLVLVDDEYVKIEIKGKGVYQYNDSWIGYNVVVTNKMDNDICISAESEERTLNDKIGGGDTCFYKGQLNKTHFEAVIYPKVSDYEMVLAIDGVTDVSQVEDVSGYISLSNNDTGEYLAFYPYHFE